MSISTSDIAFYKSAVVSDAAGNGGAISYSEIVTSVLNNMFPNVSQAERLAGLERYRKVFIKNENTSDLTFSSVKFWIDFLSTADDYFRIALADPDTDNYWDTQSDAEDYDGGQTWSKGATTGTVEVGDSVTGQTSGATGTILAISGSSVRILVLTGTFQAEVVQKDGSNYFTTTGTGTFRGGFLGTGRITAPITGGGAVPMTVEFYEEDLKGVLRAGMIVCLTEKESVDDIVNDWEFVEISAISWSGSIATITPTQNYTYSYPISHVDGEGGTVYTRVCAVIELPDIVSSADNFVDGGLSGSFDDSLVEVYNLGAEEDEITLTFTSATEFSVVGSKHGSYGFGSTGANFNPTNANTSSYYFKIPSTCWSGVFLTGDVLTFDVHAAAKAVWVKEVVPVATDSYSNNSVWFVVNGESA